MFTLLLTAVVGTVGMHSVDRIDAEFYDIPEMETKGLAFKQHNYSLDANPLRELFEIAALVDAQHLDGHCYDVRNIRLKRSDVSGCATPYGQPPCGPEGSAVFEAFIDLRGDKDLSFVRHSPDGLNFCIAFEGDAAVQIAALLDGAGREAEYWACESHGGRVRCQVRSGDGAALCTSAD